MRRRAREDLLRYSCIACGEEHRFSETLRDCSFDTAHGEVLEVTLDVSVVFVFILLET